MELKDILDAEHQLTKALPKMAKAADGDELRAAFETHLSETEKHIERLEQVFESLGQKPRRKRCEGMQGLIVEGDEMRKEMKDSSALDASLIASAQKVEHYEIASYGSVCAWARRMNHDEEAALLSENLEEEKAADGKLTEIAEASANQEAERTATTD
jgi:ferritin-like metal-binding protein YciE